MGEVEDSAKSAYFDRGTGRDPRARRIRRTASISGAAEELRLAPVNPTIFATGHGSVRDEQNLIESRSASVSTPRAKVAFCAPYRSVRLRWAGLVCLRCKSSSAFLELNGVSPRIQVATDARRLQSEWQETYEKRTR